MAVQNKTRLLLIPQRLAKKYSDNVEHTEVRRPEDSKTVADIFHGWTSDVLLRWVPGMKCWVDRKHRLSDPFQAYFLPGTALTMYQFTDVSVGFKILTVAPVLMFWIRGRDKTFDPDFKETFF